MITNKQWEELAPWRQKELAPSHTIIVDNQYGIRPGYYRDSDLLDVLKRLKENQAAVKFILDMME